MGQDHNLKRDKQLGKMGLSMRGIGDRFIKKQRAEQVPVEVEQYDPKAAKRLAILMTLLVFIAGLAIGAVIVMLGIIP